MILQIEIPDAVAAKVADAVSEMPFEWLPYRNFQNFQSAFPEATKKDYGEYVIKGYLKMIYKKHQARLAALSKEAEVDAEFEL